MRENGQKEGKKRTMRDSSMGRVGWWVTSLTARNLSILANRERHKLGDEVLMLRKVRKRFWEGILARRRWGEVDKNELTDKKK